VFCVQNGISAFGVDPIRLIQEAIRVTKPSGVVLFSSYAEQFWEERLKWFELQASAGLLGPIDYAATGNGVIVCKDGFRAATYGARDFEELLSGLDQDFRIEEVNESSLFCIISV
jgi:2-polyprenyl-6-hydroxyphenyl methylase/3-demethylubiquinone-9 3-methyltransferase